MKKYSYYCYSDHLYSLHQLLKKKFSLHADSLEKTIVVIEEGDSLKNGGKSFNKSFSACKKVIIDHLNLKLPFKPMNTQFLKKKDTLFLFKEIFKDSFSPPKKLKNSKDHWGFLNDYLEDFYELYSDVKTEFFFQKNLAKKIQKDIDVDSIYNWNSRYKIHLKKYFSKLNLSEKKNSFDDLKWEQIVFVLTEYENLKHKYKYLDLLDRDIYRDIYLSSCIKKESFFWDLPYSKIFIFNLKEFKIFDLRFISYLHQLGIQILVSFFYADKFRKTIPLSYKRLYFFFEKHPFFKKIFYKNGKTYKNLYNPFLEKKNLKKDTLKIFALSYVQQEVNLCIRNILALKHQEADASISIVIRDWESYFPILKKRCHFEKISLAYKASHQKIKYTHYKNISFFLRLFNFFLKRRASTQDFLFILSFIFPIWDTNKNLSPFLRKEVENLYSYFNTNSKNNRLLDYLNEFFLRKIKKNRFLNIKYYLKTSYASENDHDKKSYYQLIYKIIIVFEKERARYQKYFKSISILDLPSLFSSFLKQFSLHLNFLNKSPALKKDYKLFFKLLKINSKSYLLLESLLKKRSRIFFKNSLQAFHFFFNEKMKMNYHGYKAGYFEFKKFKGLVECSNEVSIQKNTKDYLFVLGFNQDQYPASKNKLRFSFFHSAYSKHSFTLWLKEEYFLFKILCSSFSKKVFFSYIRNTSVQMDNLSYFLQDSINKNFINIQYEGEDKSLNFKYVFPEEEKRKNPSLKSIIENRCVAENLRHSKSPSEFKAVLNLDLSELFIQETQFKFSFSISDLEIYVRNPLNFFFAKILNIKNEYSYDSEKRIKKGLFYHYFLEKIYQETTKNDVNTLKVWNLELFNEKFSLYVKQILNKLFLFKTDKLFFLHISAVFKKELLEFLQKDLNEGKITSILEVEYPFNLELDLNLEELGNFKIPLTGRIDRIDLINEDIIHIIDYKLKDNLSLSKEAYKEALESGMLVQVVLYIYFFLKKNTYKVDNIYFYYYYIISYGSRSLNVDEDLLSKFKKSLALRIKNFIKGNFQYEKTFLEKEKCQYCNFHGICRII